MRIVGQVHRSNPAATIQAAGIVCMAAAWLLAVAPALAQNAQGMAQNPSDQIAVNQSATAPSSVQEQRTGISHPNPAVITVTPYNDDTETVAELPPAKPSAAIPAAAPAPTPAAPKQDPDAGIVTRVPSRPGEVPDGTLVKVKLMQDLSSLTTVPGSPFSAELSEPVMRDGQVVIPAGSLLQGRVTYVHGGKRIGGSAAIHLEPRTVTLPDGSQYALVARVIDTDSWDDTKVDREGTILRKDHAKGTAETFGLVAGGTAAAGAELGGVPGALIAAGVGVGISTVVWARQDRQANLPEGLGVVFCLTEPMQVTPLSARLTGAGGAGAE